ncbi:hypothetical protein BDQ17DRAFT_484085 [Cyathus striatus]|nr:hypothetical protein BDQ17DRAFT_484085 [Cyathus striatus]
MSPNEANTPHAAHESPTPILFLLLSFSPFDFLLPIFITLSLTTTSPLALETDLFPSPSISRSFSFELAILPIPIPPYRPAMPNDGEPCMETGLLASFRNCTNPKLFLLRSLLVVEWESDSFWFWWRERSVMLPLRLPVTGRGSVFVACVRKKRDVGGACVCAGDGDGEWLLGLDIDLDLPSSGSTSDNSKTPGPAATGRLNNYSSTSSSRVRDGSEG